MIHMSADVRFSVLCLFFIISIGSVFGTLPQTGRCEETLDTIMEGFEEEKDDEDAEGTADVLFGFEEDDGIADGGESENGIDLPLELDGYLKLASAIAVSHDSPKAGETDWRGITKLRAELLLEAEKKFSKHWQAKIGAKGFYDGIFSLRGRDDFTRDVLKEYEDELELREAYLLGSPFKNLDVKIGRQIVVWGKSDNIRVTDVLNPLDMREPGMTDIEDLRLPVAMTNLGYYFGEWNLSGIAVHEIRFNKNPVFGHDFFPFESPLPPEIEPSESLENTEWAASLSGTFTGWDFALYYAYIFDEQTYLDTEVIDGSSLLVRKHARLNMAGAAADVALGNWLIKAEAAVLHGIRFFAAPGKNHTRSDLLAGVEYSGFEETTISLEVVNRYIHGFSDRLKLAPDKAEENLFQTVLRINRTFYNQTLDVTFLCSTFGPIGQDGAFQRLTAEYDVTDSVSVLGGVILYESGDLPEMQSIGDNDRIYLEMTYHY